MERDLRLSSTRAILRISTHTLTWSVTEHGHAKKGGKGNFNSHAHVERDPASLREQTIVIISTHTLTWSVTASP